MNDNARILLVDDDPFFLRMLEKVLSRSGYHSLLTFQNPMDALDNVNAGIVPDAVLTDFKMPGMNGVDLLEQTHSIHPQLPSLLLTGNPELVKEQPGHYTVLDKGTKGFIHQLLHEVSKILLKNPSLEV